MTQSTISLSGNNYTVYVSVAEADTYLAADIRRATNWSGYTTAQKQQGIISATRFIDRQIWKGDKVSSAQALEWPRSDITDPYGNEVAETLPSFVEQATSILAADLIATPDLLDKVNQVSLVKNVYAGSTGVSFFSPNDSRNARKLPDSIHELLGFYLGSAETAVGSTGYGTDVESQLSDDDWEVDNLG